MEDKITPTLSIFGSFLSKLSENSDHVYWLSSPDFKKIQYISPAYERIWGRSRKDLYANPEIWISFLHPEDKNKNHPINDMADKVARLGESARFSVHYRIIRPDGEVRWIMDNGFPVYDNNGRCCGVTGVAVDVTKEKQYELALKHAKEQAEAANRTKVEFIENMSHDIKTPLSGVIGMSDLLVQSLNDPQQKQYAQWINVSGEQLLKLLNGILEVVSSDVINEQNVHKELFDLKRCIQEVIELETPIAYLKGLDLDVQWDEHIPKFIYSDRMKVHRIILNLLGNAIKFTEKGSVCISVDLIEEKNYHVMVRFRVKDTGIGILEEQQNKVFDRFYKAMPSYKGIYCGHGVGLHIVLAYVKRLGGDIQLISKPGVGTTFEFELEFDYLHTDPSVTHCHKNNNQYEHPPHLFAAKEPCHVLIVEDNTIALKVLEAVVSNAGCHFTSAKDGEQAMALIQSMDFDLIITDIGLPGISGYELAQAARARECLDVLHPTPIIGLTAHTKMYAEHNCFAAGMNDVYSKPITVDMIHTILLKYVNHTQSTTIQAGSGPLGLDLPSCEEELFTLNHLPTLDINKAIHTIGNKELVREVLQLMISEEIQKDIQLLQQAYVQSNWSEIEKFAHKMKGGAMYIGTIRMQYACQYLERYIKAKHTRLLEPLYQQLLQVVNTTRDYIRVWLNNCSIRP